MRILSACIFSKSFGGKIENFSEVTTYRNNFSGKNSSLLTGKLKHFQRQLLTETKSFGGKIENLSRMLQSWNGHKRKNKQKPWKIFVNSWNRHTAIRLWALNLFHGCIDISDLTLSPWKSCCQKNLLARKIKYSTLNLNQDPLTNNSLNLLALLLQPERNV